MLFGLKNAPSGLQRIMNDIFHPFKESSIVYIDDILIFSKSIKHWKHLSPFHQVIKPKGLLPSQRTIMLFQTEIRFPSYKIKNQTITPVKWVIQFTDKFPNEIKDIVQLQRFLGCLNHFSNFFKNLATERTLIQKYLLKDNKEE